MQNSKLKLNGKNQEKSVREAYHLALALGIALRLCRTMFVPCPQDLQTTRDTRRTRMKRGHDRVNSRLTALGLALFLSSHLVVYPDVL